MRTGTYYDPDRSGHGLQITAPGGVLSNALWYCHDFAGNQCWLLLLAIAADERSGSVEIHRPFSGTFPVSKRAEGPPPLGEPIGHGFVREDGDALELEYVLQTAPMGARGGFSPPPPPEVAGVIRLIQLQ